MLTLCVERCVCALTRRLLGAVSYKIQNAHRNRCNHPMNRLIFSWVLSEMDPEQNSTSEDNTATILYLDRLELYKVWKPYWCTIDPWHVPNAKPTNILTKAYQVEIYDMRSKDIHLPRTLMASSSLSIQQVSRLKVSSKMKRCLGGIWASAKRCWKIILMLSECVSSITLYVYHYSTLEL